MTTPTPAAPTLTLAGFVAARLAEAEAVAKAATPGPWRHNPAKEWHTDPVSRARAKQGRLTFDGEEFVGAGPLDATVCVAATGPADDAQSQADAAHIAANDPATVLARVEADRRILAIWATWLEQVPVWAERDVPSFVRLAEATLRALASQWATHPDYDEAWR